MSDDFLKALIPEWETLSNEEKAEARRKLKEFSDSAPCVDTGSAQQRRWDVQTMNTTPRQLNMLRCHCELRGERGTWDWLAAALWLRVNGVEVEGLEAPR